MKLNPIILIIIVGLGVYVGLNSNNIMLTKDEKHTSSIANASNQENSSFAEEVEFSQEEIQTSFMESYNKIHELINNFEKIDSSLADIDGKNISTIQLYDHFKKLRDAMEDGQKLPLGNLLPKGLTKDQEKNFDTITSDLHQTFQNRKFAYQSFLEYLDNGSLKEQDEGKQWLSSSQRTLQSAIVTLEALKIELGIK